MGSRPLVCSANRVLPAPLLARRARLLHFLMIRPCPPYRKGSRPLINRHLPKMDSVPPKNWLLIPPERRTSKTLTLPCCTCTKVGQQGCCWKAFSSARTPDPC